MAERSMYLKRNSLEGDTEDWVSQSKKEHKVIFSELDVLLRALDRFFSIENLPIATESIINKNFFNELTAARDVISKVIGILEVLIPESRKNAYLFQKFAETKFLTDHTRDLLRENLYKQDTPEKGMYILYDSFINIKGIVTDLLKTDNISYLCFMNIGEVIRKEIRENNFFNPFRKDINPEFNIVENREISEIVRSIKDRNIKKCISVLYLYLFMFLRYISHIDSSSRRQEVLNSSLLILVLLRSEILMFQNYLEKTITTLKDEELQTLLKSIAFSFNMETKRVYIQELIDITQSTSLQHFIEKTQNSYGILKNLVEQSIVQISQFFNPIVQGDTIFESFTTRLKQSLKLRKDILILNSFLAFLLNKAHLPEERRYIFEAVKNFMLYFENSTFRLLRYNDYNEFSTFFNYMFSLKESGLKEPELKTILEKVNHFKIFLETTLHQIGNREELRDKITEISRTEDLIKQFYTS